MSNEGSTSTELEFTWDPAKAASNLAKHGVAFAQAATVFADALALTVFDNEHSEFEERWFTLGMDRAGKLLAVSHTYAATGPASARVRVISAREATRNERRQYENEPR
ncbi:MAG TPA: BrnT family toxin [Ideonella sp.]|nr:BrnT family toxin [Ideonella sp.]